MAAIPGSVPVTGFIAPTDDTDTFPAIDPVWGIDGFRSVADHTERNAIVDGRRRYGMLVFTQSDAKRWILNAGPWAGDDTDWTEDTGGGGSGSPAGPDGSVQINASGSFFGDTGLIYFPLSMVGAGDAYLQLQGGMEIDDELYINADSANGSISNSGVLTQDGTSEFNDVATFTDDIQAKLLFFQAGLADGHYSGITEQGTAGEALTFGQLVYAGNSDGWWRRTDANNVDISSRAKLGICVLAAAANSDPTTVLLWGNVRANSQFPTMTQGDAVYVGTAIGEIQVSTPVGDDDAIRVIGYANTADELAFNPSHQISPISKLVISQAGGNNPVGILVKDQIGAFTSTAIRTGAGVVEFNDTTYILVTGGQVYGLQVGVTTSGTGNQAFGIESSISTSGNSSGGPSEHTAMRLLADISASATVVHMLDIDVRPTTVGAGATVTNIYGARIDVQTNALSGGATITNVYGILIQDVGTRATNNYAIKTGTGKVALGGALTAPTVQCTSAAGFVSSDNSTGFTGTVTTASLVGKTITIKDGIITGFA